MAEITPRRALLEEAADIVDGDRNAQYGDPRQDFQRTATMWGAYLGVEVLPHDVAAMMALLKVSRIRWSDQHRDNWLDLAGYAACGWHCAMPEECNHVWRLVPAGEEIVATERCQICGTSRLLPLADYTDQFKVNL